MNFRAILSPRRESPDIKAARHFARELCRWNNPKVRVLPPEARETISGLVASAVRAGYPSLEPTSEAAKVAAQLSDVGYCRLPSMSSKAAAEAAHYFENLPCLNKHVEMHHGGDNVRRDPNTSAREHSFGTYTQDEIFAAPHLVETVTSREVLDAVEAVLGARGMIFSLNAYWSFPQSTPSYGQDFHRDMSHTKFCVLFIYLTNTDASTGAHQYIRHTPSPSGLASAIKLNGLDCNAAQFFGLEMDGLGFSELYQRHLSQFIDTISGPPGTMFLEDPYGLHRGPVPIAAPRLMAWARYSVFPEPPDLPKRTSRAVLGKRYPKNERARYALRALVAA